VLACVSAVSLVGPAAAEDCFPKIRAASVHAPTPARKATPHRRPAAAPARPRVHPVRHVVKRPRPKRVLVAAAPPGPPRNYMESSFAQRTLPVYLPRPVSCDEKPSPAIQALPPAPEKPPAQVLLDELAGPAVAPELHPGTPGFVDEPGPGIFFPGSGGGIFPGGGVLTGGGGGQPPFTPPGVDQPPITPPGQPPVLPPDGGQPPIILPPGPPGPPGPPEIPPVIPEHPILPPTVDQPPGGGPPPGVPEPATWAMLIAGFFGLGATLRRDHAARRRADARAGNI
jgi:hypothetical protein